MGQKFKNLVPHLKGPNFAPPSFVKFYLFFGLGYAENFMCLASEVKSLNFGGLFLGKPSNLVKHFMFLAKNFEFWKALFGVPLIF